MCSRLHGSWTLARPPTRGQHTGMPCRRMPQKGVGHRGSPGLPGQGRVVQHDGSLHAQQGGQAPGHQVVQQDGAEGGRVQVQSLRSSTCPTPHSARCRASGPAPAQPRTPPGAEPQGQHLPNPALRQVQSLRASTCPTPHSASRGKTRAEQTLGKQPPDCASEGGCLCLFV